MKTYVQPGEVLALTAPGGGATKGTALKIGSLVVVPTVSASAADKFSALVTGVATVAKVTGVAWSEGSAIYWDNSASKFTATVISDTGDCLVGVATDAAASGDATGNVRFDGVVR